MNLPAIISREINQAGGIISFARYMELALYHPEHGYYNQSKTNIGKSGDFFTSVSVGPLFGQMIAFFLKQNGVTQIVEAGANNGQLAHDILSSLDMPYWIIEPSPALREKQEKLLAAFPNVKWFSGLATLPSFHGAFISNELFDAFPVHLYRWINKTWRELGVAVDERSGAFAWREMPHHIDIHLDLEDHLPEGFTFEHSVSAEQWYAIAAAKLKSGLLLTIDYGDEQPALWTRPNGTLRAFHQHRQTTDILANPGQQDLTASVNFTRLRQIGEQAGLVSAPLQTQSSFLSRMAEEFFKEAPPTPKQARQFQTLTHPEHLGRAFKVLVQRTG